MRPVLFTFLGVDVQSYGVSKAAAALVAAWLLGRRWAPGAVFGAYLGLSGLSRVLVEYLRTNEPVVLGLTQPQLWALASMAVGCVLVARHRTTPRRSTAEETDEARAALAVR